MKRNSRALGVVKTFITGMLIVGMVTPASAQSFSQNQKTINSFITELGIDITDDSVISVHCNGSVGKLNTRSGEVSVINCDEIIVTTEENEEITTTCINLYDEEKERSTLQVQLGNNNAGRTSSSFSDVTTTIDGWNAVYGDNNYKYVITYATSYTVTSHPQNSNIKCFAPSSFSVRASSYASTTVGIDSIDYGIAIAGIEYNSSTYSQIGLDGYFWSDDTVYSPSSGRTYSYNCSTSFEDEYPNSVIGVPHNVNDTFCYIISYTVNFEDGEEVANTGTIES